MIQRHDIAGKEYLFDLQRLALLRLEFVEKEIRIYGHESLTTEEREFCMAFWSQPGVYGTYKIIWC